MNIHIIACQVLYREISYLAATSKNTTSVTWLPQGLHDTPNLLRQSVQNEIDNVENAIKEGRYKHNPDAILIGYGLCSNGTVGLRSHTLPLIIPKTDDCIALFLGSQDRYLKEFEAHPGTYWINNGWLETAFLPTKENYDAMYQIYAEQYGDDNATYLLEQENMWIKKYTTCGYITSPVYEQTEFKQQAVAISEQNHWQLLCLTGDLSYLQRLLDGTYSQKEALFCPPYHQVQASFDEQKLSCGPK